jgi:hypothetical protein
LGRRSLRYWWVNQNQTFRHEFAGSYLWSPKRKANGQINPFYEFMREVAPGDPIFSFADTFIRAIGIAKSHCYECPKPAEFGSVGINWEQIGWKVDVEYRLLADPIRPADHMATLRPHLPDKYSPLSPDGRGSQSVYLTTVPPAMAQALAQLIGHEGERAMEIGGFPIGRRSRSRRGRSMCGRRSSAMIQFRRRRASSSSSRGAGRAGSVTRSLASRPIAASRASTAPSI